MKNGDKPTQLELAKALGISWTQLKVLLSEAMPADIEGAKKWRAEHIQTPHNGEVSLQPVQMPKTTGETWIIQIIGKGIFQRPGTGKRRLAT